MVGIIVIDRAKDAMKPLNENNWLSLESGMIRVA
jgi:hypothetical protein